MASIFRKDDNFVEQPKRNSYDMSFQNNITLNFGSLRPCMCMPVSPGDSLSIKPTFGLRFLPMKFPVQTRMKASIHYFYVRNRNLWKDFPDFIGRTKQGLVPPYIHLTDQNRKMFETCQLGDFMGIPTEIYGSTYITTDRDLQTRYIPLSESGFGQPATTSSQFSYNNFNNYTQELVGEHTYAQTINTNSSLQSGYDIAPSTLFGRSEIALNGKILLKPKAKPYKSGAYKVAIFNPKGILVYLSDSISLVNTDSPANTVELTLPITDDFFTKNDGTQGAALLVLLSSTIGLFNTTTIQIALSTENNQGTNVSELTLAQLPWRSDSNPNGIPLSALPFRAYESIYNSFYRNAENNPFLIDGVPEYNKWCRTQDGGADRNFYPIMYHNWEDDFLTTAVPSPQQGNAPLVGLQGTPTLTIGHDDGSTTTAQLSVDEDGNVTAVTPLQGDQPTTAALIDAVSYGISINDFRNVNSFQRWLENNIRRGYKYRDQIKTHYGVTVRYDELDMPEFIGGTSEPVLVNQISQTVPTESSPLGDMAGQAGVVGSGQNITHYFDEHGFVIGIVCVKPVANYSQLLPKHFNVTDAFDYYFPEFGHIGMQPITYAEVTPLQAFQEGKLNDVFGYQRAWYDLISKTDEVHGLFRSSLRNFLINRTFDGSPELGSEFTVMDPDQINDVFAYTENTDKILGQIYMDIKKKTPIPLYGVAKLE